MAMTRVVEAAESFTEISVAVLPIGLLPAAFVPAVFVAMGRVSVGLSSVAAKPVFLSAGGLVKFCPD
ncbi:MAG: hypothetical protein FJ194_13950 [Gammaproteobacteria bacterium]|nr:hypothetical protein [Gammaproteobacteria bacterium]